MLKGDGYYVAVLTNIANIEHENADITLKTKLSVTTATLYSFDKPDGTPLKVIDGNIKAYDISDGAVIVIK